MTPSEAGQGPRPTPAMVPRRRPQAPPVPPALAPPSAAALAFGRVADDGTVFVRTPEGERAVGSYPSASPDEALAYFVRKYDEIVAQIDLFEQRLTLADVPVSELDAGLVRLREVTEQPDAVGDLAALRERVQALAGLTAQRRRQDEAARRAARDRVREQRTALVEEAEQIAAMPPEKVQWRAHSQRMKEIFEQWRTEQKSEPRLDRKSQEELWKRFSQARTAFDRMRRQHFAELDQQQGAVKAAKQKLVEQAEALQSSTDWASTATAYKQLMDRWRECGRAGRKDDDALWARFRSAQDAFFAARAAVAARQDQQFAANLAVKEALLTQAQALLPVTDLRAAKAALRDIGERWEAAGKVPREDVDRLERRLKAVEQALRDAEGTRWTSRNPEGEARARDAVEQLEAALAELTSRLERARAAGDAKEQEQIEANLATRQAWLDQARNALRDFSG